MAKGCEWNNPLAKENFNTNLQEHGLEYAKQALRTDIQHWMAKKEGRDVPKWKANVVDGHLVVENQRLIDLTVAPLTKVVQSPIPDNVKALVPIELETVRQADAFASQGAKKIYMPEHAPGGVRFITVYTQDPDNSSSYIGSQIDLGENMTPQQARTRIVTDIQDVEKGELVHSRVQKDAFVFVVHNINEKAKPEVTFFTDNPTTNERPTFMIPVVRENNTRVPVKVFSDMRSSHISAAVFLLEVTRRKRAEKKIKEQNNEAETLKIFKKKILDIYSINYQQNEKSVIVVTLPKLQEIWNKTKTAREAIVFFAQTGVGIGIALYGIRLLAELPRIKIMGINSKKEQSKKRKEARSIRVKKEKRRKKQVVFRYETHAAKDKKPEKKERRLRRMRMKEVLKEGKKEKGRQKDHEVRVGRKRIRLIFTLLWSSITGAVPGAGLWALQTLSKEKSVKVEKNKKKKTSNHEVVFTYRKKEKKLKLRKHKRSRVTEILHRKAGEKKHSGPKTKERRILKKEKTLRRILRQLAGRMSDRVVLTNVPKEHKIQNPITHAESGLRLKEVRIVLKQLVIRFTYTLALWIFLRQSEEVKKDKTNTHQVDVRLVLPESIHEDEEVLDSHEATQWMLFAIIWYLAMIREQRKPVAPKKKQKKKAKNDIRMSHTFPNQGIIFASAS